MDWLLDALLTWIVAAVVLLLVDRLNIGLTVGGLANALLSAFVVAVVDLLLGSVLHLLALPITIFCLGGLIGWLINAVVLWVSAKLVPKFEILNFVAALAAAFVLSALSWGLEWLRTQM